MFRRGRENQNQYGIALALIVVGFDCEKDVIAYYTAPPIFQITSREWQYLTSSVGILVFECHHHYKQTTFL